MATADSIARLVTASVLHGQCMVCAAWSAAAETWYTFHTHPDGCRAFTSACVNVLHELFPLFGATSFPQQSGLQAWQ